MRRSGVANTVIVHSDRRLRHTTGLGRAESHFFAVCQHKRAIQTLKIKESDLTSTDENVDLALLNRLVRSLPRNSLPDHPPTQPGQTHRQTHRQTDAELGNSPFTATSPPTPRPPARTLKRLTSRSGGKPPSPLARICILVHYTYMHIICGEVLM